MELALKDLLELLYTAHQRFESIQVTWQYWYRIDLMNELGRKWAAQHDSGSVNVLEARPLGINENPSELSVNWRVWWQKPACWRDEHQIQGQGKTIRVVCKGRWWSFSSTDHKLYTGAASEGHLPSNLDASTAERSSAYSVRIANIVQDVPLLDPSFLLASHDLQVIGSTSHVGRAVWHVRAVYRQGKELGRDDLFWGGPDAINLLIDQERGILLRYAAILREQELAIVSVESVHFDEPIPDSVFDFTPPDDVSIEVILPE